MRDLVPSIRQFTNSPIRQLFRLLMRRVLPAEPAEFAHLEPLGRLLLVLRRAVVTPLTFQAGQRDDVSHSCYSEWASWRVGNLASDKSPSHQFADPPTYSMISVTVPEPTVRPPSRMANRAPFSSATGDISSPVISVLSPGITISTPSGRWSVPVTSVVRT
jgi:hypothetical protein